MDINIITFVTAAALLLSGAIAGYITNKYAVRWLFKPVRILGKEIFDVSILSTDQKQRDFIDSLSDCVERRILTNDVLKKEIINEAVKAHLDEIVDHFVSDSINESFKNVKLSSLKGFEDTNASMKELVSEMLDKNTSPLLSQILEEIKVGDYLTENQINSGIDNVYECVKHALHEDYAIRDQFSSLMTELFFTSMFNPEGRAAIGKLTSLLFSEKKNSDMSAMSFPEKISASIKAAISSAVSGLAGEKSLNSCTNEETRQELISKLKKEIYAKYEEAVKNASEKDISEISEQLSGNEKIKASVSDMIFDYLKRNINRLLGGKVKETVSMALGRLDPEQLCDVAERLMSGELKYLSYFGAVLGFIVSIPALFVTLGQFDPSGFPQSPGMLIFLIILMAFIGIITNVIAIKMFFRPYKQIRFLAKFKHTKCFSQGLILQNQAVFAHTLGQYIGSELLTSENITKMLSAHKDSFVSQLSSQLVPYILSYFHKESAKRLVSIRLSAFIFNKLYENREKITKLLGENIGERTLGSFLNLYDPKTEAKAISIYMKLLEKAAVRPENTNAESYDFKFILYAVCSMIKNKPSLASKGWTLLRTFWINELSGKKVSEILSVTELSASAEKTIANLCKDDEAFKQLRKTINTFIYELTEEYEKLISDEFIKDISDRCSAAAYDSMVSCLPSLVSDMHIASITEAKVKSLEPEEINSLVLSFAQSAFHKLYALGSIGGVFGLNSYLAFILFVIDKIVGTPGERDHQKN